MDATVKTTKTFTLTLSVQEFYVLSNALISYQSSNEYTKNETHDYKILHNAMIKTLADPDLAG